MTGYDRRNYGVFMSDNFNEIEFNQMDALPQKKSSSPGFQAPVDAGLLQVRFDRLLKVTEALWSLVLEISDLTEEDLMRKVHEINQQERAQEKEGETKVAVMKCRQCGKVVSRKLCKCQYCGADYVGQTAFETI